MSAHTSSVFPDGDVLVVKCNDCEWRLEIQPAWESSISVEYLAAWWNGHLMKVQP